MGFSGTRKLLKMNKYKIEMSRGCTADAFIVNNEDYYDLPEDKQKEFVDYVIEQIREAMNRSEIHAHTLVELFQPDNWETSERCEQCGDSVHTEYWNL
jgi:hypothetical protein